MYNVNKKMDFESANIAIYKTYLKNNFKILLAIIVTAIVCISGSVYATMQYQANQIEYKNGKNVEEALNE